ncbi:hypothetical protein B0H17DRAFT_1042981 [Mycena rosella]|uniref:Transmembrane protein n=1 Tax=Mycena rosella TaxID=1033263 RepID=A0AAD7E119_MYCRO|nr:hypothetical protein B0H17DRAFT_1042981 [Mycena rosella]
MRAENASKAVARAASVSFVIVSRPLASSSLSSSIHALESTLSPIQTSIASSSHSAGPSPSPKPLKSQRQAKPKVGTIVGGALAVIAVIFAFFLWRYLVLRATRRKRLASPAGRDTANLVRDIESLPMPIDATQPVGKNKRTAQPTRDTQSKARLRQEYLAKELRAAQKRQEALLRVETGMTQAAVASVPSEEPVVAGAPVDTPSRVAERSEAVTPLEDLESARRQNDILRRRIRELEEQQQSDWARGLSDEPPPGYSE